MIHVCTSLRGIYIAVDDNPELWNCISEIFTHKSINNTLHNVIELICFNYIYAIILCIINHRT